ncbi:C-type lectin domain family 4 member E-like isoform X2 [Acipenser ruthenus]|uniref:C-type lectin domain family 4 member E-like isoform X2 n=1 Tax=Acipenser ruthenus TaxID=7906 RepID=UPI0027423995|nr:C-type lectin domain family 4 member E-like isoform X2 [Acipenser ruthenus]
MVNVTMGKVTLQIYHDPTLPVSAAGKASSYRQPALVLLILCCLLLAAIISLAVYHFKTNEDPEKYNTLLNQLQDLSSKNHSELKKSNTELFVKSSILDKYCPLKEGSSKERGCCPVKWMQFNGKCYYFSTDTMDWNSSRDNCTSKGGHLVIIESKAEQKFLTYATKAHPGNRYWIGLTDAVTEGTWLWVDGTPLNDKTQYWVSGEPNDNNGKEDCAILPFYADPLHPLNSWNDIECQNNYSRICETIAVIIYQ